MKKEEKHSTQTLNLHCYDQPYMFAQDKNTSLKTQFDKITAQYYVEIFI